MESHREGGGQSYGSLFLQQRDQSEQSRVFDSFCEDFYNLVREIPASNERIWRMIITDMFFSYDEKGWLYAAVTNNSFKRKQFAILANVILGELRV